MMNRTVSNFTCYTLVLMLLSTSFVDAVETRSSGAYPGNIPNINTMSEDEFELFLVEALQNADPEVDPLYNHLKSFRPVNLSDKEFKYRAEMKEKLIEQIKKRERTTGCILMVTMPIVLIGSVYLLFKAAFPDGFRLI